MADVTQPSEVTAPPIVDSYSCSAVSVPQCWRWLRDQLVRVFLTSFDDVWTLEGSLSPYSLHFYDSKIESCFIWNMNKRYCMANRYFCWFMTILLSLLIVYNWMVECFSRRFLYYLPINIVMLLPMPLCAAATYLGQYRYCPFRYMHWILAASLTLSAFAWMLGQPVVLLSMGDPLILDPISPLYIFILFNIATITFYLAFCCASFLVLVQVLTCACGLAISGRPDAVREFTAYLSNDFLGLILAYLFALLSSYTKNLLVRQCYLVRHFQQEEARILAGSRFRLELTETGMKVMKKVSFIERDVESIFSHQSTAIVPIEPRTDPESPAELSSLHRVQSCPAILSSGQLESPVSPIDPSSSGDPELKFMSLVQLAKKNWRSQDEIEVRVLPSSHSTGNATFHPELEADSRSELSLHQMLNRILRIFRRPADESFDEIHRHVPKNANWVDLCKDDASTDPNSLLIEILNDLPIWLRKLPHIMHSKATRKDLGQDLSDFIKYKICMHPGDNGLESAFGQYYNPVANSRFRIMVALSVIGSWLTCGLDFLAKQLTLFGLVFRLGYMTVVALLAFVIMSFKRVRTSPTRSQTTILLVSYLITIGYLLHVFLAYRELRNAYTAIDPMNRSPTLATPSTGGSGDNPVQWMPKSPFHGDNPPHNSSLLTPTVPSFPRFASALSSTQTPLMNHYIDTEATLMVRFNSLVLFTVLAAGSSGIRFSYYLLFEAMMLFTVMVSSMYSFIVWGFDGAGIRIVLVELASLIAGGWIARPLENEMRKWFILKTNYQL